MNELFVRRRRFQPRDDEPMNVQQCQDVWNDWCTDFMETELTPSQRLCKHGKITSIFNAYMHRKYSDKRFFFGLLQAGVSWRPSRAVLQNMTPEGIEEHVATGFVEWSRRLVQGVRDRKNDPATDVVRSRSQYGLTPEQAKARRVRDQA